MENKVKQLCGEFLNGKDMEFLFFWGHRECKDGRITKSCFSQWWKCKFEVDGVEYNCMEQYMMAEKARVFKDDDILKTIMETSDQNSIKKLGRKVKNFDSATWDKVKYEVVVKGNFAKFSQNENLKQFLLSTKDKVLVEASPYDSIWGIGKSNSSPDINDPTKWNGLNLLGFALMDVRKLINDTL